MNIEALDQKAWGVCGFVAAFQAANINQKPAAVLGQDSYATLMPLIDRFVTAHPELAAELLNFTASFGEAYIYKTVKEVTDKMHADTTMSTAIGLAMTANGVSKLCKDLGFANYNFIGTTPANSTLNLDKLPYKNAIYGIARAAAVGDRPNNFRSGLVHWIYVDAQGNALTWAKKGADAVNDLKARNYNKITHYLPLG